MDQASENEPVTSDIPALIIAAQAEAVKQELFLKEEMGVQGILLAGWTEVDLGVYSSSGSNEDGAYPDGNLPWSVSIP